MKYLHLYRVLVNNSFHSTLIQNGPPKGPPALYSHNTKGLTTECVTKKRGTGSKSYNSIYITYKYSLAFSLLQKGPPALCCHNTKVTLKMNHPKDHQLFFVIIPIRPLTKLLFGHQIIPQYLLNSKWTIKRTTSSLLT